MMGMKSFKNAILGAVCMLFVAEKANSQRIAPADLRDIKVKEDSLRLYANKIIQGINAADRFRADSAFIRMLMRTLKTPYSFDYPFDSLQTISIQYPPDSSFRIFTWQFMRDDNYYRQRGMIQLNTKNGELQRHPLFDASEFTDKPLDSVRTFQNWIGAIYYKIIQKEHNNKRFYTLIGFDDHSIRSTRKWIDVLHFENGQPVFGGDFFSFREDSAAKPNQLRYGIEYKKNARARLNYDEEMDIIVIDHLISEINEPNKKFTLIPDGDYEGFAWKNGQWVHIDKIFNFQLKDGEAPVGDELLSDDGKVNEEKLKEKSEKNRKRKN